ncbi:hypothetical protein BAXH7_02037 [Bacillus amyloliquefaciens XH7]|nr:hypothetical protein LL3_01537 [Bacillus amyloliquefaciens LL3]AEK89169.1 hypothetical protein BAXH7_02037 [Bacillus amyloliquefaciens XH7]
MGIIAIRFFFVQPQITFSCSAEFLRRIKWNLKDFTIKVVFFTYTG